MKGLIIDVPSKVSLVPCMQPCKNVEESLDEVVIKWTDGKKRKINTDNLKEFISDTKFFIEETAFYSKLWFTDGKILDNQNEEAIDKFRNNLNWYMYKWGTPITNKIGSEKKLYYEDLLFSCFSAFAFIELWNNPNFYLNSIYEILDSANTEHTHVKSWYLSPMKFNNKIWLPETENKFFSYSSFFIRLMTPKKNEFTNELQDKKNMISYIRRNLLDCLSEYMNKRFTQTEKIKFNSGYFEFEIYVSDRLLAFLLYNLPELLKKDINYCKCGCGGLVIGKRKYIKGHLEKSRNSSPDRKIKAWVRGRKNKGHITDNQYKYLSQEIDKMLNNGMSESEVRLKIGEILKKLEV